MFRQKQMLAQAERISRGPPHTNYVRQTVLVHAPQQWFNQIFQYPSQSTEFHWSESRVKQGTFLPFLFSPSSSVPEKRYSYSVSKDTVQWCSVLVALAKSSRGGQSVSLLRTIVSLCAGQVCTENSDSWYEGIAPIYL